MSSSSPSLTSLPTCVKASCELKPHESQLHSNGGNTTFVSGPNCSEIVQLRRSGSSASPSDESEICSHLILQTKRKASKTPKPEKKAAVEKAPNKAEAEAPAPAPTPKPAKVQKDTKKAKTKAVEAEAAQICCHRYSSC